MSNVYCIKPLEKKSISWRVEMFRENSDGSTSWFNMEELYRWGQGFIEEDLDSNLPYKGDRTVYCKTDAGWGCEFDDSISVDWEFSDDISEEEQEHIKNCYYDGDPNDEYERGGAAWLYEGNHDWQFEDDYVIVLAPFSVDYATDNGDIINEDIELKERPPINPNTAWPWSNSNPKPDDSQA
jgi:hypothetical protein